MATFAEIQHQVTSLRQRREIFLHLLEHIDGTFRSVGAKNPPKVLVTPDKVRVPEPMFEAVSAEISSIITQIDQHLAVLESSQLQATPPPAPPEPQESERGTASHPDPQPRRGRRGRRAQGVADGAPAEGSPPAPGA